MLDSWIWVVPEWVPRKHCTHIGLNSSVVNTSRIWACAGQCPVRFAAVCERWHCPARARETCWHSELQAGLVRGAGARTASFLELLRTPGSLAWPGLAWPGADTGVRSVWPLRVSYPTVLSAGALKNSAVVSRVPAGALEFSIQKVLLVQDLGDTRSWAPVLCITVFQVGALVPKAVDRVETS